MANHRNLRADIIRDLPGDVLDNILSRLPLRDAVRTCTLSKQWRYKWQTIPELVFDLNLESAFPLDQVLLHHKGPLQKFVLKVPGQYNCSDIDRSILHLSKSTVQDFTLNISSLRDRYRMPSRFFAFQHLSHLKLCGCEFKPPPEFEGLRTLVTIDFQNVDFEAPIFGNFVSRCLKLETINLTGCTELDSLEIEGQSLRVFGFHGFAKSIRFKNCPLLVRVQLCTPLLGKHIFQPCYCKKLFKSLPNPNNLHLYPRLLEFSDAGDEPNQFPCLRVICLTMRFASIEEVDCALRFIRRSPNVERLRFDVTIVFPPKPTRLMTPPIAVKSAPPLLLRLTPAAFRLFATTSSAAAAPSTSKSDLEIVPVPKPSTSKPSLNGSKRSSARDKKVHIDANQLKLNWLESLSCPSLNSDKNGASEDSDLCNSDSGWVVGIDPDLSGALAVIKPDNSPQVYDSPHLNVLVGKRVRKRLDVKSIIQLLQCVDAPIGTTVYIEQSIPFPQDGKQGWWSGGFGYGLWIGIMVASGYSVVPVPSQLWKNEFKLTGDLRSSKDNSRELASTLFPSMSVHLRRKKDHGRAEALLIAAYGKGLKVNIDSSCVLEDSMPLKQM